MQTTDPNADEHPVDKAARLLGGRPEMAKCLEVSVAAIGNWKARGVPFEVCPVIERLTDRKVMRYDLRPDDWADMWPELAKAPAIIEHQAIETIAQSEPHRTGAVRRNNPRRETDAVVVQAGRREGFSVVKGVSAQLLEAPANVAQGAIQTVAKQGC